MNYRVACTCLKMSELIIFMCPEYITVPSRNSKVGTRWYTLTTINPLPGRCFSHFDFITFFLVFIQLAQSNSPFCVLLLFHYYLFASNPFLLLLASYLLYSKFILKFVFLILTHCFFFSAGEGEKNNISN